MTPQEEKAVAHVRKALEAATSRFVGVRAAVLTLACGAAGDDADAALMARSAAGLPPRKDVFVERHRVERLLAGVAARSAPARPEGVGG